MAELITCIKKDKVLGNADLKNPKKKTHLMRITGVCTSAKEDTSTYGAFFKLGGEFKAINVLTGEEFRSGKAILPPIANDLVAGQIMGNDETNGVQFIFDIGIKPGNSPTGYEWWAEPLLEASESDPLAALEVAANLPELPAPVKTASKENDKEKPKT